MNILHLSIVVYIGNGDGVGALRRRRSDAAMLLPLLHLSIILFCIPDAVFRFAFFFGQLLCFFLGDFTQTHAHMHICSVSAACAAAAHSLSTLSSLSQALFLLLLPDVSLSLLLRFVLSHLLSCSLTDLSLGLAYQAAVVVVLSPSALPAAPSLVVFVLLTSMGVVCLILRAQIKFESLNRSAAAQQQHL